MDIFNHSTTDQEREWVVLLTNSAGDWEPQGPFTTRQVQAQMRTEKFKPTDYCWKEGWTDWKRIYEEPSFYHSRKPPRSLKTVKKESVIEFSQPKAKDSEFKSLKTEWAEKIKPQTETKDGSKKQDPLLESWAQRSEIDFIEKPSLMQEVPEELAADSLKKPQTQWQKTEEKVKTQKTSRLLLKMIIAFMPVAFIAALGLDFWFEGKIYQWLYPEAPPMVVSYVSVRDFDPQIPRHLLVSTDLKKDENLVVRILTLEEKLIRTLKGGAGLIIPSKGSGELRIPLYPYDLKPGTYKAFVQAPGAEVLKVFIIPPTPTASQPESKSEAEEI